MVYHESWNKGVRSVHSGFEADREVLPANGSAYCFKRLAYRISKDLVAGFDLYEALLACQDLLSTVWRAIKFAAGLTLKPENMELFSERFENIVAATITEEATETRTGDRCRN